MLMSLQNSSEGRSPPDSAFVHHGQFLAEKMFEVALTLSFVVYSQL